MAKRKGRKPKAGKPVSALILDLVKAERSRVWLSTEVLEGLRKLHPSLNAPTIRTEISHLIATERLLVVGREGHANKLKLGRGKSVPLKPSDDRALIQEARLLLIRLEKMLSRHEEILRRIERFRTSV